MMSNYSMQYGMEPIFNNANNPYRRLEDNNTQEIRAKYITYKYAGQPQYTATCMQYCENCRRDNNPIYYKTYYNDTGREFDLTIYDRTLDILKRIGHCNGCTRTVINNELVKNERIFYPFENAILSALRKLPLDIKLFIFSFLEEQLPN